MKTFKGYKIPENLELICEEFKINSLLYESCYLYSNCICAKIECSECILGPVKDPKIKVEFLCALHKGIILKDI